MTAVTFHPFQTLEAVFTDGALIGYNIKDGTGFYFQNNFNGTRSDYYSTLEELQNELHQVLQLKGN